MQGNEKKKNFAFVQWGFKKRCPAWKDLKTASDALKSTGHRHHKHRCHCQPMTSALKFLSWRHRSRYTVVSRWTWAQNTYSIWVKYHYYINKENKYKDLVQMIIRKVARKAVRYWELNIHFVQSNLPKFSRTFGPKWFREQYRNSIKRYRNKRYSRKYRFISNLYHTIYITGIDTLIKGK